ncbi:vacuolar v-SNARE Nyv1p [Monosporozyma unispora]
MATRFSLTYLEVLRSNETVSSYLDIEQTTSKNNNSNNNNNNNNNNDHNPNRVSYGSINQTNSNNSNVNEPGHIEGEDVVGEDEMELFHKIIEDMVVPKVINNVGNKVTKVSMTLLDGYDCYYTTMPSSNDTTVVGSSSNNNEGGSSPAKDDVLIVCFTKLSIPKILPIRVLSELKQLPFNEIESNIELRVQIGDILDKFHEELINYRNENLQDGNRTSNMEDDIQDVIQIMNDNIDKFLERQERVSLLVDKTSKLNNTSHNFRKKANKIKDRLWWQRMKNTTLLIFAIILCISALFIFIYVL